MAYTTIYVTAGMAPRLRRRAHRAGPRAVASRSDYARLLVSAGFDDVDELDVTAEFATTARAWIAELDAHTEELAAVESPGAFEQRLRDGRRHLRAVEDGLLRRGLFSATRR